MDHQFWLAAISLFLAIGAQTFAIIKFMMSYMDKKVEAERDARVKADDSERAERLAQEASVDSHLNKMRDNYIHKEDFYRNMDQMQAMIASVKGEVNSNIHALKELVTAKIDLVINTVMQEKK